MANAVRQHLNDALVIRACITVVAKTLAQVLTAHAPTIIPESVANTNTMPVKLVPVRMVRLASTMALVSLACVLTDTPEKLARKILLIARRTHVHHQLLALTLLANSSASVRSI